MSMPARKGEARAFLERALTYNGEECLIWPYALKPSGYGDIKYPGKRGHAARIVCMLVHGQPPVGDYQVAHSCNTPACVAPRHLRWATPKENAADRAGNGTDHRGTTHWQAKLTESDVKAIRASTGRSQRQLAAEYGVDQSAISNIVTRRNWNWLED